MPLYLKEEALDRFVKLSEPVHGDDAVIKELRHELGVMVDVYRNAIDREKMLNAEIEEGTYLIRGECMNCGWKDQLDILMGESVVEQYCPNCSVEGTIQRLP